MLAVSGSINCVKHLQATAVEAGVDVDLFSIFNELGEQVPVLSAVAPNGPTRSTRSRQPAARTRCSAQLAPLLDLEALTVTGRTLRDNLAGVVGARRRGDSPARQAVLATRVDRRAPRLACSGERNRAGRACSARVSDGHFEGTAVVYDDVPDAIGGVQKGELKPGHVLVLRGCGPKGGPAMAGSASRVVFAIYAAGLENEVAFVSDGQLSGLCNKGMTIAEVSPESAVGGPLALVENGDRIRIDIDARTLDLDVPPDEIEARRLRRGDVPLPTATGYLSIYQRSVQPMSTGAVLVPRER